MATWDSPAAPRTAPPPPTPVNGTRTLRLGPVSGDDAAYVRIAKELYAKIESGQIEPGGKMPTITTLRKQHACARRTAGHALQLLESQKLIERIPGLGYHVRRQ